MDTGLAGKNVLITGASRNMGRLVAIQFAREGANLAVCTSTKMQELHAVAEELRSLGATVVAVQCDVAEHGGRRGQSWRNAAAAVDLCDPETA